MSGPAEHPARTGVLTQETAAKLAEIMRLLEEAYTHYFAHSDGHCKSSEGAISLRIPPFFWRADEPGCHELGVSIYSYVLGPSRQHDFASIDEALETVRAWHATEMATRYDEHGDVIANSEEAGPAT